MSTVTVFAPSPIVTVTVEDHPAGGEVHVHAGGQGVWQARMLRSLGVDVTLVCVLSGELGRLLRPLLAEEGIEVAAVTRDGRGAAYVHDRRAGHRDPLIEEPGDPLGRHELDELYGLALQNALQSGLMLLSGPMGEDALPADTYRRLAADARTAGVRVVADLAGERARAVVDAGVHVLKISHEELIDDGLAGDGGDDAVLRAMSGLARSGAETVIVTRAGAPILLMHDGTFTEITPPQMQEADHRGAGDSLTAGVVAALARGEDVRDAITLGAAAGAVNVTRHGLGTGQAEVIEKLRDAVTVRERDAAGVVEGADQHVTPDQLAARAEGGGGAHSRHE